MTHPSSPLPPDDVDAADWSEQQHDVDPLGDDAAAEAVPPVPPDLTTAEVNEADLVEQLTEVHLDEDE